MTAYASAKQRLFAFKSVSNSVFCLDDSYVHFMAEAAKGSNCHYYSEQNSRADFHVKNLILEPTGCRFILCHPEGEDAVFFTIVRAF